MMRHGGEAETARLSLRRPNLADVPALFEFLGNAEAMRHTHVDKSLRDCRRRIAVHEWRRRLDGYAPWTIVTKADGWIIGWGGLYEDPFDAGWGAEVGYFFHPAAWRRGYATELIAACTALADQVLGLAEVKAFARPENGTFGNTGKGILRGPGIAQWDISLFKNFNFTERMKFQLRFETFNTFNHTQFSTVDTSFALSSPGEANSQSTRGTTGQITGTRDPRTIQLGGKFYF